MTFKHFANGTFSLYYMGFFLEFLYFCEETVAQIIPGIIFIFSTSNDGTYGGHHRLFYSSKSSQGLSLRFTHSHNAKQQFHRTSINKVFTANQ